MFERILVGVDGRVGSRDAIALAQQLAAPRAHLMLGNVYGSTGMLGRGRGPAFAAERADAQALLNRERIAADVNAETVVCDHGNPGKCLRELTEDKSADLLVMGRLIAARWAGSC